MTINAFDTDTELSSVNSILGAIGQSPVTSLDFTNPEISFIYNILKEVNTDVQNEGWVWNREDHYPIEPQINNGTIPSLPDDLSIIVFPSNVLRMDIYDNAVFRTTNVIRRDGCLYDKLRHSYEFTSGIEADIIWKIAYEDLPTAFKRYITYRSSVRAATQLVSNPQLVTILAQQEAYSRAICMEYECNQGDYSIFGTPEGTAYRPYQPYRALHR